MGSYVLSLQKDTFLPPEIIAAGCIPAISGPNIMIISDNKHIFPFLVQFSWLSMELLKVTQLIMIYP